MKFKIRIDSGHYAGKWYADFGVFPACCLTSCEADTKIFTKFPRALYDKKHDRLVHVWDNSEGD